MLATILQNCELKLREKGFGDKTIKEILTLEECMICPISLEVMTNPVFFENLRSGNQVRFERLQMCQVLSSGNRVHPFTGEGICFLMMEDDVALRDKIVARVSEIEQAVNHILAQVPEGETSSKTANKPK